MMKNFKIKYTVQTSSRCGKYNYNCIDTVNAIDEQEAISEVKSQAGNKFSFKRYKVIIRSVEEVPAGVEIHR